MRIAIDAVAKIIDDEYTKFFIHMIKDVWELRNDYFEVISGNLSENDFLQKKFGSALNKEDYYKSSLLLAAQLNRQKMYTSCGWFFESFDRIEPYNAIFYAVMALVSTEVVTGKIFIDQVTAIFPGDSSIWIKCIRVRSLSKVIPGNAEVILILF